MIFHSMKELKQFIIENDCGSNDRNIPSIQLNLNHEQSNLTNFYGIKPAHCINMMLALYMRGDGQRRKPMVLLDPALSQMLNKQGYFSYNWGRYYIEQREKAQEIFHSTMKTHMLFINRTYILYDAPISLGSIHLYARVLLDQGKRTLLVTNHIHFAECSVNKVFNYHLMFAMSIIAEMLNHMRKSNPDRYHDIEIENTFIHINNLNIMGGAKLLQENGSIEDARLFMNKPLLKKECEDLAYMEKKLRENPKRKIVFLTPTTDLVIATCENIKEYYLANNPNPDKPEFSQS